MSKIQSFNGRAEKTLSSLTFKNLQREVIKRGMPFENIAESDYNQLASFLINNFDEPKDETLLSTYDRWLEALLIERGADKTMIHPSLGYGYLEVTQEEIEEKEKPKVKKKPKVKNSMGVTKGTKKALTYKLAVEGVDKKETIEKVLEQFPDASLKSIGIWFNKALKENK